MPETYQTPPATKRLLNATGSGSNSKSGFFVLTKTELVTIGTASAKGHKWFEDSHYVAPPDHWSFAVVDLVDWHFSYRDGANRYDDHHFGQSGVRPGLSRIGDKVRVSLDLLMRDKNGDDRWRGEAMVRVSFYQKVDKSILGLGGKSEKAAREPVKKAARGGTARKARKTGTGTTARGKASGKAPA